MHQSHLHHQNLLSTSTAVTEPLDSGVPSFIPVLLRRRESVPAPPDPFSTQETLVPAGLAREEAALSVRTTALGVEMIGLCRQHLGDPAPSARAAVLKRRLGEVP